MDYEAWKAERNRKTGATTHAPKYVTFQDFRTIIRRFQNFNITTAAGYYYAHWVNCVNVNGADNEHCRKCRWIMEQMTQQRQVNEWDDWFKEEHFDVVIGQHFNRLDNEHFTEVANALKALREKRDEIVKNVVAKIEAKQAEDGMFKIRSELAKNGDEGIKALITEGKLSSADVDATINAKLKVLRSLKDDGHWNGIKSSLHGQLVNLIKPLREYALACNKTETEMRAQAKKHKAAYFSIPYFKLDYEKPGMYEYSTWFGKFVPRTWQYGFFPKEEE
jgi:hypothetical protein